MTGHLLLDCATDAEGKTWISRQSFRAPMHLSKPYWDGSCLIVNAVNPTAGLFPGDRVDVNVRVRRGASVVLTSPSASRIHRGETKVVTIRQHFEVENGGWLDVFPELLIPHEGSRYVQETSIHLQNQSGLFFTEMLAPGRVTFGEAFVFEWMEMRTDLWLDGKVVALDRHRLSPADDSIHALRALYKHSYYAACFLFNGSLPVSVDFQHFISQLSNSNAMATASYFPEGLAVIRIIAEDSITLKRVITAMRTFVYETIGRRLPVLRKQ